jgi:hypothetical protein
LAKVSNFRIIIDKIPDAGYQMPDVFKQKETMP